MAVNFCLPEYKPSINCTEVSADGYSVQNLISEDASLRRKGFYVEHFIKPPVNVNMVFPISLELHSIVVGLQVGGQRTSAVEIWTSCCRDEGTSMYQKIGFGKSTTVEKLTFVNKRYRSRKAFSSLSLPEVGENSIALITKWPNHLNAVRHLKVLITRTRDSSIPCLSQLTVWAQPSWNCPKQDVQRFLKIAFGKEKENAGTTACTNSRKKTDSRDVEQTEILQENQDIPEEFLDPITCSLMSLPMLLPSGHTVDQSTLDRFIETEASWGRKPSDPFTGVTFRKDSQPIPSASLKARIDQFIIQNLNKPDVKDVGRTVGQKNGLAAKGIHVSSLVVASNLCTKHLTEEVVLNQDRPLKKLKCEPQETYSTDSRVNCEGTHESQVSESLDSALKAILGETRTISTGIHSVQLSNRSTHEDNAKSCTVCCQMLVARFYVLPCSHIMCRTCLLSLNNRCSECHNTFSTKDVHSAYS